MYDVRHASALSVFVHLLLLAPCHQFPAVLEDFSVYNITYTLSYLYQIFNVCIYNGMNNPLILSFLYFSSTNNYEVQFLHLDPTIQCYGHQSYLTALHSAINTYTMLYKHFSTIIPPPSQPPKLITIQHLFIPNTSNIDIYYMPSFIRVIEHS